MKRRFSQLRQDTRAASYTLGTILIIGLATTATISGAATGFYFIEEQQQLIRYENAENAMSEMDSRASLVALEGNTHTKSMDMGLSSRERLEVSDSGTITIRAVNRTTGNVEAVFLTEDVGKIEYQTTGTKRTIAYQAGGVWKKYEDNRSATMVSPPEIHYRGNTLTMPLIMVNESESNDVVGADGVTIKRVSSEAAYPTDTRDNPIENVDVQIVVQSEYYMGWADFFSKRISENLKVEHDTQKVIVPLKPQPEREEVSSGMAATSSGSGVTIKGSGGADSFIDSYDSSDGNYATTQSDEGTLTAASDITMRGGAKIYGDVTLPAGYSVDVKGGSEITGNVYRENVETQPINQEVTDEIQRLNSSNNNNDVSAINGDDLATGQSSWSLPAGDYYIEGDLVVESGETLTLNTTNGDVNLAVSGDVELQGGTINIEGEETDGTRANVYMSGGEMINNDGTISIDGQKSSKFWIYAYSGLQTQITNGATHVGVVYAPGDGDDGGVTEVNSHATVYGGLVGGTAELQSGGVIHYDQSLSDAQPLAETSVPRVTYLHISINEILVNGGDE